jgi:predicted enzyme related to lactoylglutathione lyase
MENNLAHFAINADDVEATRAFYEAVFGWEFRPYGPPGFYRVETESGVVGAIQERRELVPGQRTIGFECTIAVGDVDEIVAAVTAGGGRIVMEKTTIPGVGDLIFFADPSGNVAGAMRYDFAAE